MGKLRAVRALLSIRIVATPKAGPGLHRGAETGQSPAQPYPGLACRQAPI